MQVFCILFVFFYAMLRSWRYIIVDLETTGLDTTKDEPVQIGMLVFNEHFEIVHSFSSYIKPATRSSDLKEIVHYLTGITAEQLIDAPSVESICAQIAPWFDDNTVIVGHNVRFDVQILSRYMPLPHKAIVDTYDVARIAFHFLPSYSLSVIYDNARQDPLPEICTHLQAHDALSDCVMTWYIFKEWMSQIHSLLARYPLASWYGSKSHWRLAELFVFPATDVSSPQAISTSLPPLKKNIPSSKKNASPSTLDIRTMPAYQKYSINNIPLRDFFSQLPLGSDSFIFSFAHKPKTQIAKSILQDLGYSANTFHDSYVFDEDMVHRLLQKPYVEHEEFAFLIKYFSALDKWHTIIDLNTEGDYKIFSALTSIKPLATTWCILSTHDQIWTFAHKILPEHIVLFFDHEWRFQMAKKQANQQIDLLHILTLCEQIAYKYDLRGHTAASMLQEFARAFAIFIGILHIEINQLYIGYQANDLEIQELRAHTRLPKVHLAYAQLQDRISMLLPLIEADDAAKIQQQFERMHLMWVHTCTCSKQMRWGDRWYFTFTAADNFVSYEEMVAQLPPAHYIFLTHTTNPQYQKLILQDLPPKAPSSVRFHTLNTPRDIVGLCTNRLSAPAPCIYVICAAKTTAQQLFNTCMAQKMQHTWNIQVENITWGHGSALFQASKSSWPRLLIGGFSFFLQACAKNIPFTDIVAYHLEGPLKHHILADMTYYAEQ